MAMLGTKRRANRKAKILAILQDGELSGRDLRRLLDCCGYSISTVAFYYLMARLEDAGLVTRREIEKTVFGNIIIEHRFTLRGGS